jgi:hypothetical protein
MQNSNEEDFKIKYLKYKAKYLELKDLLEGGIPKRDDAPETVKLPCFAKSIQRDERACNAVKYCSYDKSTSMCSFDKLKWKYRVGNLNNYQPIF